MSDTAKRMIGESTGISPNQETLKVPKAIIEAFKQVKFWECPHCHKEIHEHHSYEEEGQEFHSDCGGAFIRPPTDWSKIAPAWRALLEPKV